MTYMRWTTFVCRSLCRCTFPLLLVVCLWIVESYDNLLFNMLKNDCQQSHTIYFSLYMVQSSLSISDLHLLSVSFHPWHHADCEVISWSLLVLCFSYSLSQKLSSSRDVFLLTFLPVKVSLCKYSLSWFWTISSCPPDKFWDYRHAHHARLRAGIFKFFWQRS